MKIHLSHTPNYRFKAKNEAGNFVLMDASSTIGGENSGFRPMEMLLAGLGGCSGIDVVSILNKKKQAFSMLEIVVEGDRNTNEVPSLFHTINVVFIFEGKDINNDKIMSAVNLSMEKYCSVAKTLEKTAKISHSVLVNNNQIFPII